MRIVIEVKATRTARFFGLTADVFKRALHLICAPQLAVQSIDVQMLEDPDTEC